MGFDVAEQRISQFLDLVYDAAVSPRTWPDVLRTLADMFDGCFADIFTRSHDRRHFGGLAHGLDKSDYDDLFLGFWFNRNVWGLSSPTTYAGEVASSRSLLDVDVLRRSEIYNEYLHPRGLHEGLRLALWVDDREIQDISILRPGSRGPFGAREVALGAVLLPHLQRAATVSRRLRRLDFARETASGDERRDRVAAFAFDAGGALFWFNAEAERLLAEGTVLKAPRHGLEGSTPDATRQIRKAVARAVGAEGDGRAGGSVPLPMPDGASSRNLVVLPSTNPLDWTLSRPPAAVAFTRGPPAASASRASLQRAFALTDAEADLALRIASGQSLGAVAAASGRSRNTLRTHLARLMEKTGTHRQTQLAMVLLDAAQGASAEPVVDGSGSWSAFDG